MSKLIFENYVKIQNAVKSHKPELLTREGNAIKIQLTLTVIVIKMFLFILISVRGAWSGSGRFSWRNGSFGDVSFVRSDVRTSPVDAIVAVATVVRVGGESAA
jgi:hypothetical protein